MKKKIELVFIPTPVIGHLTSAVEFANLLVDRYQNLSITMLLIKPPFHTKSTSLIESLSTTDQQNGRIQFITLPEIPIDEKTRKSSLSLKALIENQKLHVLETITKRNPDSPTLAGFVVDMFCITMIDVANQFNIPTYVFFTSGSGFLSLLFHLQDLYDRHGNDMDEVLSSVTEFSVPGFDNPISREIVYNIFYDKDASKWVHGNTMRFREAKGVLVNTFSELEADTMRWFSTSEIPTVYPVGPILNLKKKEQSHEDEILKWLDEQPPSSVLFLCFGSLGSFNEDQIKEIAFALERTGVRFLWSLRQTQPKDNPGLPSDSAYSEDVLPEGFLDRTAEIGRVIGWAPQVEILAHPATGGFISHCGWNSTLESLWHGVPMAAWPMYAEQQFNAFQMVVELGLAVDISLDYNMKGYMEKGLILSAENIESGIRKLMEDNEEIKKVVKIKSEESKNAVKEGGSSFIALDRFINSLFYNFP
nr:UDP-glycosyltranserase [Gynostemma pentaphyllum]